jgi:hypothetical protein
MLQGSRLLWGLKAAITLCLMAGGCRSEADPVEFVQPSEKAYGAGAGAAESAGDLPNRTAKQSFLKPRGPLEQPPDGGNFIPVKLVKKGPAIKSEPPLAPLKQTKTKLVEIENGPFPYRGTVPATGRPFLDVHEEGRQGHRTSGGGVHWEDTTYSDRRTLLHLPSGFDARRPALLILFLHGHGATLERDVIERQKVPEQVSEARVNAVLVAPQLALDAADSSAGKLWEEGGLKRYLDEVAGALAKLHGDSRSKAAFDSIPIVIVAYSGGYATAASSIRHGGVGQRIRGVVLLDALYGEVDTFASWISSRQRAFFLSAYAASTKVHNAELEEILKGRDVAYSTKLQGPLLGGSVTFVSTDPETGHRDFVTHAWTHHPVRDLLQRLKSEKK